MVLVFIADFPIHDNFTGADFLYNSSIQIIFRLKIMHN